MKLRDFMWEALAGLLLCILAAIAVFGLTGCGTNTRTQTQDDTRITGTLAGAPVDVQVQRRVAEQSETKVDGPNAAALIPLLPLGGPIGVLGGAAGGIAFGLWQLFRARGANAALSQTVGGLEAFKQAQPAAVEALHAHLGRAMDTGTKARVRQAKAAV